MWVKKMANTYTQIYIRGIFAVQNRISLIAEYIEFLKKFDIEYDERYVFKPVE